MTSPPEHSLRLDPASGPTIAPIVVSPGRSSVIGRGLESEICLLSEGVSRRHAMVQFKPISRIGSRTGSRGTSPDGRWFITDLNSSPGTFVNGVRLAPNSSTLLAAADLVRIGPWTFRVSIGPARPASRATARTLQDSPSAAVTTTGPPSAHAPSSAQSSTARQRLDQLIECTLLLMDAPGAEAMARVVLDAALGGTGYTRGAILSCPAGDADVEIVQTAPDSALQWRQAGLSRSLVREAAQGRVATLTDRSAAMVGAHTIDELRIHSAVCAPVIVGSTVVFLLYLDARGDESRVQADAESFCGALARMYGMAIGSAMRVELENRRAALEGDLAAAREAQQLIMPKPDAVIGRVRYAVRNVPGRFVAGDLFDAIDIGAGRVGITIGDVSGEGAGSAILMASTQAYLHAALRREPSVAAAARELNHYVCQHSPLNRFISAWVGVLDLNAMTLTYADAGHGHWVRRPSTGAPEQCRDGAGIPLGIEPDYDYQTRTIPVAPGDRLILFSDGLLEQQSPSGEEFGIPRILKLIGESAGAEQDADTLMRAVQAHAGRPFLDDDTTVASVEVLS